MLFYKKKFAIIILFAAALILSGIYITDNNMKSITLLSGDKVIDFQLDQDILVVNFLGSKNNINLESIKPKIVLNRVRDIFSRILSNTEIR